MAITVLALLGQSDRAIHIGDAHERHERHHLFVVDERVLGARFPEEELCSLGNLNSGVAPENGRVLANQVFVDVRGAIGSFLKRGLGQRVDL